jgi:hypothetical protein
MKPHQYTNAEGNVLILKRINKSRIGYGNFLYPTGIGSKIICSSWSPTPTCGEGIHGWPWGFGLGEGIDYDISNDIWLVLSDTPENIVGELDCGWKCKAKEPTIIFEGSFRDAISIVTIKWPEIVASMSLAASGDGSNLAASGDWSNLAASGDGSNLAASGDWSKLAASGKDSKLAASGDGSNLAASGNESICMVAGVSGAAMVGKNGSLVLTYWDGKRFRHVIGYEGEDNIRPNTFYHIKDGILQELNNTTN